jgi:5-methyltetrahydrofolate--homocysteine methyltransferase
LSKGLYICRMTTTEKLHALLAERILIIDGAMGTMIQNYKLSEEDYRGSQYKNHTYPQRGNNDLLSITQPSIIETIHQQFLEAGADIIETNTFNSNRISMLDYGLENEVVALNTAAVTLARKCADAYTLRNPGKPRFVAGALGPTNKTASLSPDVNNPGFRAISFDELVAVYKEQAAAMMDAGVDLLLVETVFDTLNCKAALFSINTLKEERGSDIPVMVSGTITDASGRTLSGQTPEAFWISIAHADLFSVGLNCALGAAEMAPHISELSKKSWVYTTAYPNAGLPNEFGEYDETPERMGTQIEVFLRNNWVNILGGCCGTTPDHIRKIAELASHFSPRKVPVLQAHS